MHKPNWPVLGLRFDDYLLRHLEWGWATFGSPAEGRGPPGPLDHLKKELKEIQDNPSDVTEWIDAIILSIDGFYRAGGSFINFDSAVSDAWVIASSPLGAVRVMQELLGALSENPADFELWERSLFIAVRGYVAANNGSTNDLLMQMFAKQRKNFNRDWPDWRQCDPDKAVEHVKGKHD
jgi:hypothetical protein